MKLPFGLRLARESEIEQSVQKAAEVAVTKALSNPGGGWTIIQDFQAGAFEQGLPSLTDRQMTQQACVYACETLIANSIAKLPLDQIELKDGAWQKVPSQFPLLTRPSKIANRITWVHYVVACMLSKGAAFGLKRYESGQLRYIELLHPTTEVLVSEMGEVFYRLNANIYSHLPEVQRTIPGRFIFHVPYNTLIHPLIGVPPLEAARAAALSGSAVMAKQARTHQTKPEVYGFLKVPVTLNDAQALAAKTAWQESNGADGVGIAVLRNGVDFQPLQMTAKESESSSAMTLANEDIARAFGVPKHLLGIGTIPSAANAEALMLDFYSRVLQPIAELIELALDEALELPSNVGVAFDVAGLSRLDSKGRNEAHQIALNSGKISVNEARAEDGLPPVKGGETPRVQMQDVPIDKEPEEPSPPPQEPADDDEEDDPVVKAQVFTLTKDVASLERDVAALRQSSGVPESVTKELAELKTLTGGLAKELGRIGAERAEERKQHEAAAKSAEEAIAALEQKRLADCEALRKELAAAVTQAEQGAKWLDGAVAKLKSLETANVELGKSFDDAKAREHALEKALSESEVSASQAQESLRKELTALSKHGTTLEKLAKDAEKSAAESQVALQKAMSEQSDRVAALEKALAEAVSPQEHEGLRHALADSEKQISALAKALKDAQESAAASHAQAAQASSDQSEKIAALEKALEESAGKAVEAKMALKSLTERVEKAEQPKDDGMAQRLGEIIEKMASIENHVRDCMRYEGVWEEGSYTKGAAVSAKNSLWVATRDTDGAPGDRDSGWKLCIKYVKPNPYVDR